MTWGLSIRRMTAYRRHLHTWRGGQNPKGTGFTHVPPSSFSVAVIFLQMLSILNWWLIHIFLQVKFYLLAYWLHPYHKHLVFNVCCRCWCSLLTISGYYLWDMIHFAHKTYRRTGIQTAPNFISTLWQDCLGNQTNFFWGGGVKTPEIFITLPKSLTWRRKRR